MILYSLSKLAFKSSSVLKKCAACSKHALQASELTKYKKLTLKRRKQRRVYVDSLLPMGFGRAARTSFGANEHAKRGAATTNIKFLHSLHFKQLPVPFAGTWMTNGESNADDLFMSAYRIDALEDFHFSLTRGNIYMKELKK
jgi:hypothetical protein